MKSAVIYTRVSTDEQKEHGFSLQDQKKRLTKHCVDVNWKIVAHFEEHHSAKNFNRPEFQKLLNLIKSKKIQIDVIVVTKIDRFSREAGETMNMVKSLQEVGIAVYSLNDGEVDFRDAKKFFPLIIHSAAAQYENLLKSETVIWGMRQAMRQGRYIYKPPIGYQGNIITKEIDVDAIQAPYINEAFTKVATGLYSADEVRRSLIIKGFKKISKQTFLDMLRKPIYYGLITIDAYRDEPVEYVKGIHKPIISEELFLRVQHVLNSRKKNCPSKITQNENLPLRGHLICNKCNQKLTGSGSRGRNKNNKHFYYHCQHGCNERFRADIANNIFGNYLSSFEIPMQVLELYKAVLKDVFKQDDESDNDRRRKFENELERLEERKKSISVKFADDLISAKDFSEIMDRFNKEERETKGILQELNIQNTSFIEYIDFGLPFLFNLKEHYNNADVGVKGRIVGSIFPEKLIFSENKYRTTKVNELLLLITNNINGLGEIKKRKADISVGLSSMAPSTGLEPVTL